MYNQRHSLALVVPVSFPVWAESVCEAVSCYDVSRGRVCCVFVSFVGWCVHMCDLCQGGGTYLYFFHKSNFIRLESSTTLYERGAILANAITMELKARPRLLPL